MKQCACGCGDPVTGRGETASHACHARIVAKRKGPEWRRWRAQRAADASRAAGRPPQIGPDGASYRAGNRLWSADEDAVVRARYPHEQKCGDCDPCIGGARCYQQYSVKMSLRDTKGGDPSEWPEDLRVRQFPEVSVMAPVMVAERALQELLANVGACDEARKWAGDKPLTEAWTLCERGDWMLWLAGRMADQAGWWASQQVVCAACDCAELTLVHVPAGEERPKRAIEIARQWARGENVSPAVVRAAAYDADDAASAAVGGDAVYAAAASAAYAAAFAAYADYDAAAAAAAYAADGAVRQCADIVRRALPLSARIEATQP